MKLSGNAPWRIKAKCKNNRKLQAIRGGALKNIAQ